MKRMWILLTMVCVLLCTGMAGAETVTGTGVAKGFNEDITVDLTLKDGKIIAVNVDHDETPGMGDVAIEKLVDAIVNNNSINVDAIAGATFSSLGILEAAKNAIIAAGFDPNDYMDEVEIEQPTEPDEETSNIPAGAFVGTGKGFGGEIKVGIIFNGSRISAVYVDHDETAALGSVAIEKLVDVIVNNNSINVDAITGATLSSRGLLEAAKNAIIAAGFDPDDYMDEVDGERPTEPDEEASNIPAGAYTGTAVGFMGEIKVGITFNGSKIAAVYVDHNETPALGGIAVFELADEIVSNNSINVDVVTNATVTSKAMLAAAKNALIAAGLDPNDYMGNAGVAETPGDPDGDGNVTISDALAVLRYCAGGSAGINLAAADVTGDGKVDVKDVLRILQHEAGWNVKLQ